MKNCPILSSIASPILSFPFYLIRRNIAIGIENMEGVSIILKQLKPKYSPIQFLKWDFNYP